MPRRFFIKRKDDTLFMEQKKTLTFGKEQVMDLVFEVLGAVMFSIGFYSFAENAGFAPGGVTGLAMLIRHFVPVLPLGTLSFCINIPIILCCAPILGKTYMMKSVRTLIIVTLVMDGVLARFPTYTGDPLLASLFSGLFAGIGLALIYMRGSTTGGSDFVIAAVKKKNPHLSFGQITLLIDGIIIVLGWPVFGSIDAVLYGAVSCFVYSMVMDKIMYGAGSGKLVIAITNHGQACADAISDAVERGATIAPATGSYTGMAREMVYCACANSEVFRVRRAIHTVDPRAMMMICEASEVYGEGFRATDKE